MAEPPFPYPLPNPLERLHVHDGLMMNADRWQIAHRYHRLRQNVHYQALYQPGIVYGLGVKVISPPQSSSLRYRSIDQQQGETRWLEIQPGIAIDIAGNPIIVDPKTDRTYRIAIDPPTTGKCIVYLVVSYVDPDALEHQTHKLTTPELFRFDQKTNPPNAQEVELCRVELSPGGVFLKMPQNVFAPGVNEINLLHRVQAQARSQIHVRVGAIAPRLDADAGENCEYLIRSLPALYSTFQGDVLKSVELTDQTQYDTCDLLFAHSETLISLSKTARALEILKHYCDTGGVLLLETVSPDSELENQTQQIINLLQPQQQRQPQPIPEQVLLWSDLEGVAMSPQHSLRTQPFLFTVPPTMQKTTMQIAADGGVIWVKGPLSEAWGIRGSCSRNDIRAAQELGINFLYFAWRRRHLTQLMQWPDAESI